MTARPLTSSASRRASCARGAQRTLPWSMRVSTDDTILAARGDGAFWACLHGSGRNESERADPVWMVKNGSNVLVPRTVFGKVVPLHHSIPGTSDKIPKGPMQIAGRRLMLHIFRSAAGRVFPLRGSHACFSFFLFCFCLKFTK